MASNKGGKLDRLLEKLLSRKLLVFLLSTLFLITGVLNSEQWISLALAYVGIEGFADIVVRYNSSKLSKTNNNNSNVEP